MTCGVYEIWINKYFYQGSSKNIEKRIKQHKNELEKNKHINLKMQHIFNKYKTFEYQILVECDKSIFLCYEQDYINANWEDPNYMNLASNASIPPSRSGKKQSDEAIEKSAFCHRKKIICNGIIYKSIVDASKVLNVSPGQVSRWLAGTRKKPANITISYYSNQEVCHSNL
jgi:hypothetical protein